MSEIERIEEELSQLETWALRRQKGVSTNRKLFVLACMDERLPVEEVLGLEPGDAHVFRNAGGLVTDDVVRSAALSIHFFHSEEVIVVSHTDCGMLGGTGPEVTEKLESNLGVDLTEVPLDPGLSSFKLKREEIHDWWKMQSDIDQANRRQIETLRNHPLIPKHVQISGYVYDVATGNLRHAR